MSSSNSCWPSTSASRAICSASPFDWRYDHLLWTQFAFIFIFVYLFATFFEKKTQDKPYQQIFVTMVAMVEWEQASSDKATPKSLINLQKEYGKTIKVPIIWNGHTVSIFNRVINYKLLTFLIVSDNERKDRTVHLRVEEPQEQETLVQQRQLHFRRQAQFAFVPIAHKRGRPCSQSIQRRRGQAQSQRDLQIDQRQPEAICW